MTESKGYKTRQRSLILSYLASNRDRHITAEEIISHFRSKGTKIGKSTVYRYLNLLLEKGIIRKYLRGDGPTACYRYVDEQSTEAFVCHVKCERCGKVENISCEEIKKISAIFEQKSAFQLDLSHTVFYGQCVDCKLE